MHSQSIPILALLFVLSTGFYSCKDDSYWTTEYVIIHKVTVKSFKEKPDYYTENWDADGNADLYLRIENDDYYNEINWESQNIISNASPNGEYEFTLSPPIIAHAYGSDLYLTAYDHDVASTDPEIGYCVFDASNYLPAESNLVSADTINVTYYSYGLEVEVVVEYANRKNNN